MLCSDGSVYLFSMAYYKNANGRKTYGLYSSSLLGNVPDVMANYAAGSALYYADNRLYISVLTTSASKLSYVDLTADIFWPISIGQISAAPVALYSALQNAAADNAAALAPWAERQTGMQALEPAAAETLTAQPLRLCSERGTERRLPVMMKKLFALLLCSRNAAGRRCDGSGRRA